MFELSTRLVTETFQELSAEFQTAHIYRNDVKHEESPHHLIDTALARFCCNSTMALESICIWILHNISEVLPVFCWILFVWSWLIRFGVQEVAQRMQEKPSQQDTQHRHRIGLLCAKLKHVLQLFNSSQKWQRELPQLSSGRKCGKVKARTELRVLVHVLPSIRFFVDAENGKNHHNVMSLDAVGCQSCCAFKIEFIACQSLTGACYVEKLMQSHVPLSKVGCWIVYTYWGILNISTVIFRDLLTNPFDICPTSLSHALRHFNIR